MQWFQSANKRVLDSELANETPVFLKACLFQSANKRVLDSELFGGPWLIPAILSFQSANKRVLDSESHHLTRPAKR